MFLEMMAHVLTVSAGMKQWNQKPRGGGRMRPGCPEQLCPWPPAPPGSPFCGDVSCPRTA